MPATLDRAEDLVSALRDAGFGRGAFLAVAVTVAGGCIACCSDVGAWTVAFGDDSGLATIVGLVEAQLRPRWVWWSGETGGTFTAAGIRVATCWDVAAVHRLIFGGWRADPARAWAALHGLGEESIPQMGQLGLLDGQGDEGTEPEEPTRPDGHLRPEWTSGGWTRTPERMIRWAATSMRACEHQQRLLASLPGSVGAAATARSESAAELLCTELAADGLPIDVARAESIIAASVGPRPHDDADAAAARDRRDALVLGHVPSGTRWDLRNPAHVRSLLREVGVEVADTRAWRLEPFRAAHPLVDALLTWRKAERIATTYGYAWLDRHVGADGRLRGAWTGCDGAAGRMTAQAGLHNLPSEMRDAVASEAGHVFVHADLGQIEPRVLAAVSGDRALAGATTADDLYSPVAERLGVDRATAKVAFIAAMYGQTTGTAGQALRGMEAAYPVAMQFLRDADLAGQAGRDVRTYGGRRVRMWSGSGSGSASAPVAGRGREDRAVSAARGRYARNAMIQGAAAELFKAWAVTVRGRIAPFKARIVLCLHDELLVHTPAQHGAEVAHLLEAALSDAANRWMPSGPVRFVATASVVARWSEAKA